MLVKGATGQTFIGFFNDVLQQDNRRNQQFVNPGLGTHHISANLWNIIGFNHLFFNYSFVLIYLIRFIIDCFIRTCRTKIILISNGFVGLFFKQLFLYLLVGWWSVVWLVVCLYFVVFVGWLDLVHSCAGWLPAWPHHDHFTFLVHKTQVQRWSHWLAARV